MGLVGASGTGKSSVAWAAFGPLVQGVLPNRRPSLAHMYRKLYTFAHRLWYGEVVTKNRRPEVLTTSATRSQLTSIVADFRRDGSDAEPVVFGSHRKAEAALIPIAMLDKLLPLVEDMVAVEKARSATSTTPGRGSISINWLLQWASTGPTSTEPRCLPKCGSCVPCLKSSEISMLYPRRN